jgi:hypothetical protein
VRHGGTQRRLACDEGAPMNGMCAPSAL